MNTQISRRHFIQKNLTAALTASTFPALVPSSVLGAQGQIAPSNRLMIGCIGVGPQGRGVMGNFLGLAEARVVALCDVLKRNLSAAVEQVNKAYGNKEVKTYSDFRELLARRDIDGVLIATPDHWHVPVAIAAAKAGKDMYLEKPMGLSVEEDVMLRQACQRGKRIFQFGTQQRSSEQFRKACELVRNGRIGKLQRINAWCAASRPGGPTEPAAVPEDLDYNFWLGPAADVPYTEGKAFDTQKAWKTWWFNSQYALGFIAGWGIHPLDIALWGHPDMMKQPMEIEGKAIIPKQGACDTAVAWDVRFNFGDGVSMQYRGTRNGAEPCEMNNLEPWAKQYGHAGDHGTAFEGTDGWVLVDRGTIRTKPETLIEEKPDGYKVRLIQSSNHARNFLDSMRSRRPAICPIEDSVQGDILCHLSDIAGRLERKLRWDPVKEKFIGDKEANKKLVLREMRKPWRL